MVLFFYLCPATLNCEGRETTNWADAAGCTKEHWQDNMENPSCPMEMKGKWDRVKVYAGKQLAELCQS